jgi:hypothetical protein
MPAQRPEKTTFWRHVRNFLETPAPMGIVLFLFSGYVFCSVIIAFYICEDMITDLVFTPRGESILRKYVL